MFDEFSIDCILKRQLENLEGLFGKFNGAWKAESATSIFRVISRVQAILYPTVPLRTYLPLIFSATLAISF